MLIEFTISDKYAWFVRKYMDGSSNSIKARKQFRSVKCHTVSIISRNTGWTVWLLVSVDEIRGLFTKPKRPPVCSCVK